MTSSYFIRTGPQSYTATEHTSGAWNPDEQHIAPAIGLLAHLAESDVAARRDDVVLSSISCDILGTIPLAQMDYAVEVIRPGRTIELVEVALSHGGRRAVTMRAWFLLPGDTATFAASPLPGIPDPSAHEEFIPSSVWPGGCLQTITCRRLQAEPGRASYWLSTEVPLIDDARASALARACGMLDLANGMTVRAQPDEVLFPNIDLTAHFFRTPDSAALGFDTSVSFGGNGTGLTHSVLHDAQGPLGTLDQTLTVRPVGGQR